MTVPWKINLISDVHIPVLLQAFVDALCCTVDGDYVDATFGRGGHSRAMLERLSGQGRLLGLDRDTQAVSAGMQLVQQDSRFHIAHTPFSGLDHALNACAWHDVDGVGFDLGVSSPQLSDASRGFSFQAAGPLDMRMDTSQGASLAGLLAHVSERELTRILRDYGNERYAGRMARAILNGVHEGRVKDTRSLENVCFHAVPAKARYGHIHPATRAFQALRIWVNDETGQLKTGVEAAIRHLKPGGRLVVISFHSGEDRMVRDLVESHVHPCVCPPDFPVCACGKEASMRWIQKKPIRPAEHEVSVNPRSRSAKMRVAERI